MRTRSALASILIAATGALAQSDPERPVTYLWDLPGGILPGGLSRQELNLHKMVIVNVIDAGSAANAAAATRQAIEDQIAAGVTDRDHVCIMLGNFGTWPDAPYPYPGLVSFIDYDDALYQAPSWAPGDPDPTLQPFFRSFQPWMRNTANPSSGGIATVKQWMQDYLAAYALLTYTDPVLGTVPLPVPARFHFDSEWGVTGCCEGRYTAIMAVLEQDPRWGTMPVPGYGTLTMADLYAQARSDYGWLNLTLHDTIIPSGGPADPQNRPYWIWYSGVCQHAKDAAMKEAAYDEIHIFSSPAGSWAGVEVSNYGDAATDGQPDRFGWYAGGPLSGGVHAATNEDLRGRTDENAHGAAYSWYTGGTKKQIWLNQSGAASGDFSAPYLYAYNTPHYDSTRRNFYLPSPQTLTATDANLSNNRRWVESILNSPSPFEDPIRIAPWVPVPGQHVTYPLPYDYDTEEFRQTVAMLRAKNTREVLLWWIGTATNFSWQQLAENYDMVYRPKLASYSLLTGSPVPDGLPPTALERLQYTLRYAADARGEKLVFQQSPIAISNTIAVEFKFDDVGRNGYYLNLELGVDNPTVRGEVFVWNFSTLDWEQQAIDDFPGSSDHGSASSPTRPRLRISGTIPGGLS